MASVDHHPRQPPGRRGAGRGAPGAIFPRLPAGAAAPPPARVAAHQRARLMGAMMEAVRRSGYRRVTVGDLVGLAGVSRKSFYGLFTDKEDCFLATLEEIAGRGAARVRQGIEAADDPSAALEAGLDAFSRLMASEQVASHLALVDSLSLGPAGVPGREGAAECFEPLVVGGFAAAGRTLDDLQARWIVAGWGHAAYRALREGRPQRLRAELPDLLTWALACQAAGETTVPAPPTAVGKEEPRWSEPVRPARTRPARDRRPRLLRAAAQIAAEDGVEALSIPAISRRARTSNVAFYEEFTSTQQAFLAAFEELWSDALGQATTAFAAQADWSRGIVAALAELLAHVARDPILARLAFFELPAVGCEGLERGDAALDGVAALLRPAAGEPELPAAVRTATVGALWATIRHEITQDRAAGLTLLTPRLAALALAPFRASGGPGPAPQRPAAPGLKGPNGDRRG